MANVPLIQVWQGQTALAKEGSWGSYTAPSAANQFIFHKLVKVEDVIEDNADESYQGVRSKTQGFYPGFRYAKVTIDFYVSQLNTGNFLMAYYGTDSKTGTVDPVTHAFTELAGTPPSYTISNFDATISQTRAVTGAYLQKLSLSYAEAKGMFMGQATFLGKYVDATQTKPSATYDTTPHYLPYQNVLTLNGTPNAHLIAMKMEFDQEITPNFGAAGTQDVTAFSTGSCTTTGEATFNVVDATEINLFRGNTQGAFLATFTNTSSHSLAIQMTKCAFKNGTVIDQSGQYVKVNAKLEGVRNTTDAGPSKTTLINTLTTAY